MAAKSKVILFFGAGLAGLAGWQLWKMSQAAENFSYDFNKIRFSDFTFSGFKVKFNLVIDNPTSTKVVFKSFVGNLFLKEKKLAFITTDLSVKPVINPSGKSNVAMISNVPWDAAPELLLLKISKKLTDPLTIRGLLTVGPIKKEVEKSFSLSKT